MNVSLIRRVLAFLIDACISAALAFVPLVGAILSALFMLLRDGMMDGRSPGKRILGLRVVRTSTRGGAGYVDSIKRNLILAVPDVLMVAPALASVLATPLSVAILVIEVVFMLTDPDQMRLGDRFAGTRVIERLEEVAGRKAA